MEPIIVEKNFIGQDNKVYTKKMDESPVKVRYANGYETVMKKCIAEVHEKRGKLKILGEGKPAPKPEREVKKIDRNALMKEAIELGLGDKKELLGLSDAELQALVGEAK
jgi:hypothetical protein